MHHQQAADALLALALGGIDDAIARVDGAGVDAQEGEAPHVGVAHHLEGKRGKGRRRVGRTLHLVAAVVHALGGRHVERRRHEVHDGVQQRLHALVLERRAAEHGCHVDGQHRGADGLLDHVRRDVVALEVGLGQLVIAVGKGLDELLAGHLGVGGHGLRDGAHLHLGAQVVLVGGGVHLDQVDDARELRLGADGQLDGHGLGAQAVDHGLHGGVEVGADAVHLVDVGDARHAVAVGLAPHGLGLRLHAGHRVEHGHGAVEHAQRALHLDREVHVAGGVDDVDAVVAPEAGGGGGGDGDAALLLLLHPVHGGGALVHLADAVGATGVVEDALGRGGLARIDVGHDPDVPGALERDLLRLRH